MKCARSRVSDGTSMMSISPSCGKRSDCGHRRIAEPKPRPLSVRARNSQRPYVRSSRWFMPPETLPRAVMFSRPSDTLTADERRSPLPNAPTLS